MNRRIFFHGGSFASASLLFTKVIWQKEKASAYRHRDILNSSRSGLFFSVDILHSSLNELELAKASERKMVVTAVYKKGNAKRKKQPSAKFTYEILSSRKIRTETILSEQVHVYLLKANLISCDGELQMHTGLGQTLEFIIKPGLSVTIRGEEEIYIPYCESEQQQQSF